MPVVEFEINVGSLSDASLISAAIIAYTPTNTNERLYHCMATNCNKDFIQRSALTVHSRTHTGEKPHVCDHEECQKAFSDANKLKIVTCAVSNSSLVIESGAPPPNPHWQATLCVP
ncbi:hypothetical protein N7524_011814 [Penicillium chrysogenum]|nr:hypothetical protein N7524_011814 [Penicillium chrysogenum]